jgi:4-carboxymuconolactone decarboxylase
MKSGNNHDDTKIDPVGQAIYEEVLGKGLFEDLPAPLVGVRELTINHLFAKIWSRSQERAEEYPPLNLRERRLVTIALLAAQGRSDQLREHITGACTAGIPKESLIELMIHIAHYAGWAAGTSGQSIVIDVYENKNCK